MKGNLDIGGSAPEIIDDTNVQARYEEEALQKDAARKQRLIKIGKRTAIIGIFLLLPVLLYTLWLKPYSLPYNQAMDLIAEGQYEAASELLVSLGDYKDSALYLDAFEWVCIEEVEREPFQSNGYVYYNDDVTYYFYNNNGILKHKKTLDSLGDEDEYLYDDFGNITSIVQKNRDGQIRSRETYSYSDSGLLIKKYSERPLNDSYENEAFVEYHYDGNNQLIKEVEYADQGYYRYISNGKHIASDPELYSETSYAYDNDGNILTKKVKFASGCSKVYKYTYNYNGKVLTEEFVYSNDSSTNYICEYTYDNNGNILTSNLMYTVGGSDTVAYTYDSKGNVSSMIRTMYDPSYSKELVWNYRYINTYDSFGNLKSVETLKDGESIEITSYEYRLICRKDKFPG